MQTSPAGRAAIKQREGCRLVAYADSVSVITIGVGHTGRAAPPKVARGMRITQAQADAILAADLKPTEAAIDGAIKRPMTGNQYDACASLAFNIGGHGFANSTVVRRFNAGDVVGAANAFLLWCRPPELKGRRQAERAQFLKTPVTSVATNLGARTPVAVASIRTSLPKPLTPPPPGAAQPAKVKTMPFFVTLLLALFGATSARAAEVDFSPLVSAGIANFAVPLLGAFATWLVSIIGVASKKYLDQKTAALLAQNVDGVLQKAISFGSSQALAYVGSKDLHANVDGWIAGYAVEYANGHAPQLMKQAGDVTQKVIARLAEHPDVAMVKATIEHHDAAGRVAQAA